MKPKNISDAGNDDADSIKSYLDSCLSESARIVLLNVQMQGGYYDLNYVRSIYVKNHMVPVYYYHGNNLMPTESSISSEISRGVKIEFEKCIPSGIKHFEDIGWQFKQISPITVVTKTRFSNTGNSTILITVNYPAKATLGKTTYLIDKMDYTSISRMGIFLNVAKECTDSFAKNPGWFNMKCVIENNKYYTISDRAQEGYTYFEYMDAIPNKWNDKVYWRFALIP